ncbi:DUF883 family protein [Craterilacuibacter sinensis]|uniref:DUF883 family protein n=1 Tax=Craterilacuibacter sinensis TaxID=2686017 RepID=A0A845BHC6_9NEIS|nr:DUF883 family protein [Craterilacuibacter sinensis]MXR35532.1 DUF883 family protein [Craterilacuibacter sinensis]
MADNNTFNADKEQLLDEVRNVLNNTEELLASAGDNGSEKARELHLKLQNNLKLAKDRLLDAEKAALARAKEAAKVTDQYVHTHPWKAIGLAAAVAFLLGLLVSRR